MSTEIPGSWYKVLFDLMSEKKKPFVNVSDIIKGFFKNRKRYTLQYIHHIGRIMWFNDIDQLQNYIFHRPEVLSSLIGILYDHRRDKTWEIRSQGFSPYRFGKRTIDKREYLSMVEDFKATGIIDIALLHNLLNSESYLPAEIGITLLKTFHLICGPIFTGMREKFIVPYFATRCITTQNVHVHTIPLRVDLCLNGLPVPSYVYHLITAAFLDMHINSQNEAKAGVNGASVEEGNGITRYLSHDTSKKCVSLITYTSAKRICDAWRGQIETVKQLTTELQSVWKGIRYEHVFYCSHCLMTNQTTPATQVNPEWYSLKRQQPSQYTTYTGDETCSCDNYTMDDGGASRHIPRPLRYPCEYDVTIITSTPDLNL